MYDKEFLATGPSPWELEIIARAVPNASCVPDNWRDIVADYEFGRIPHWGFYDGPKNDEEKTDEPKIS